MANTYNKNEVRLGELSNLRRLAYFAAVVETGSFTAAAERLGITKAVVSQQVARLEQEFRTSLLVRTTRKVQPTESGQAFYVRCARILGEAEEAFGELGEAVVDPVGTLKLTAPFDYGISRVVPAIAAFSKRYPDCKVDAVFSDQTLDLMSGSIELAIRVGWLKDSDLQARQIGTFRQLLVAPRALRSKIEKLTSPEQLADLPFVANTALREPLRWDFTRRETERISLSGQASIFLDTTLAVREAVLQGVGLSVLPDFAIADDLATGRLIHVLPQWQLPVGGIHVVFPSARFRPVKVRAFVDVLASQEKARYASEAPG
ncbi:DNA-binding transcriptional LysR family regulator [Massilia sp. MP_M2]|uniref:LysR family transcriptional regulator n=1 Tax=Massilia sp. MP_M2 TaxID=3071713 RepID=UPI00319E7466